MRDLRELKQVEAEACLDSWERHLDYLSPALVVFCLADDHVPNIEKIAVAYALLAVLSEVEVDFFPPPANGKVNVPGPDFTTNKDFWPDDGSLPSLAKFIGKESWLIFSILEMMDPDQMEWLAMEVQE